MRNVRNQKLISECEKLGIKDVRLCFDGTCMIWSEDADTDRVFSMAGNSQFVYIPAFKMQSVSEWVADIKRCYESGKKALANKADFNGHSILIKCGR